MLFLNPQKAALLNSITLIVVGLIGYIIKLSPTALIPVILGLAILITSFFYNKNNKLIAHIIATLILLIIISLFMPLKSRIIDQDLFGILRITIMQLISIYSLTCFVKTFIDARSNK